MSVLASRRQLLCGLCRTKGGACIQCEAAGCTISFHPQCAREGGIEMVSHYLMNAYLNA